MVLSGLVLPCNSRDRSKLIFYYTTCSQGLYKPDEKIHQSMEVDAGTEIFGKGDQLIAMVRFTQFAGVGSLRMERTSVEGARAQGSEGNRGMRIRIGSRR